MRSLCITESESVHVILRYTNIKPVTKSTAQYLWRWDIINTLVRDNRNTRLRNRGSNNLPQTFNQTHTMNNIDIQNLKCSNRSMNVRI